MGEVSNKTLATLLVVAILISLGGTFVSLNKLGKGGILFSGLATINDTSDRGFVYLNVSKYLSIDMTDRVIDFGSGHIDNVSLGAAKCDSSAGTSYNWINTSYSACDKTDTMAILNDGDIDANVTIKSNATGAEFLGGTGPELWYKVHSGACDGTNQSAYNEFAAVDTEYPLCDDVNPADSFTVAANVTIPIDMNESNNVAQWNFTAYCAATGCTND